MVYGHTPGNAILRRLNSFLLILEILLEIENMRQLLVSFSSLITEKWVKFAFEVYFNFKK